MINIGRLGINLGWNNLYCFGLGLEYHTMVSNYEDLDSLDIVEYVDARVLRLDFLFFFINFTAWAKQEWDEN